MSAITTVAELDALPTGTRVADRDGDTWRKTAQNRWNADCCAHSLGGSSARLLQLWSPLAVVEPERTGITTIEQLDALPVGAVLVDSNGQGDAWQKRTAIAACPFARVGSSDFHTAAALLDFAPLLLAYVPENGDAS